MKPRRVLIAAVALGSLAAPPLADAKTKPRTVHFTAPFDDEGSMPYGIHQCGLDRTGVCDFKFDGHTSITGDLTSSIDYFGYFHLDPVTRVASGESWDRHAGSLKGCGSGSFVWHQYELVGDFNDFDPVTRTIPFSIKWRIVAGSGTGDFAEATGSGTGEARATLQFANKGTYTGSITCPRGRNGRSS